MKAINIEHPALTEDRPLARLLWLLFCGFIWLLGVALSVLTIERLYYR